MNPLHKTIGGIKHYLVPPSTYLPCLTQEEIDTMWPNATPSKGKATVVIQCDDCNRSGNPTAICFKCKSMPSPKHLRHEDSVAAQLVRDVVLMKPDGDMTAVPNMTKAVSAVELEQVMNVLSAPERLGDNVTLPHHYARFKIEPIRFSIENNLNGFQFNIVKYILRHDAKNGIEDLKKARRYLEMFIKFMEGDEDWWK